MKQYMTWPALLLCIIGLAAIAASAAARPRHQATQASAQADGADRDMRYDAACRP